MAGRVLAGLVGVRTGISRGRAGFYGHMRGSRWSAVVVLVLLTVATGTAETVQRGVGLLVAYSAGLGLPFLLSAVALSAFLRFVKRYRPFIPAVERFAGVVLVIVGVLVFTNYYLVLNAWAIALTPDWLLRRL